MVPWLPVMALDAMRYRLSSVPFLLQGVGAVCIGAGWFVMWITFRANTFASPAVKIQTERAHSVVAAGPYRHVRHPMYGGAVLLFFGMPLLLGSWYGLIFAPLFAALLAVRIPFEERVLAASLPGYRDYQAQVRWRLIPHLW
jgi:protein-S-isoprenylcysteine O-methyltransferase Ste14